RAPGAQPRGRLAPRRVPLHGGGDGPPDPPQARGGDRSRRHRRRDPRPYSRQGGIMIGFVARRLGQGVVTILILTVIVFAMSRLTGDPLNLLLPIDATLEEREFMERRLGLDRPIVEQFFNYLF